MSFLKLSTGKVRMLLGLREDTPHQLKWYHIELPIKSVSKIGKAGGGNVKSLKAGETYCVHFETSISNKNYLGMAQVHDLFMAHGIPSAPCRFLFPKGMDTDNSVDFLFDCKKDININEIPYGIRLSLEAGAYGKWET
jgi:hypothetical protein